MGFPLDKDAPFRASPNSFAFENNLYDTSGHDSLREWDQESDLSHLEGLYAPVWPDIFQRAANKRTKRNLARYLALSYLRHPNQKQGIQEINRLIQKMAASVPPDQTEVVIHHSGGELTVDVREMLELSKDTPENASEGFLRSMRSEIEFVSEIFFERKWGILVSEEPIFITGDCPVVLCRGTCVKPRFGLGTPGTQISFPLLPTKVLMIDDAFESDGATYALLDVGTLNTDRALASSRFVFGATERITGFHNG